MLPVFHSFVAFVSILLCTVGFPLSGSFFFVFLLAALIFFLWHRFFSSSFDRATAGSQMISSCVNCSALYCCMRTLTDPSSSRGLEDK